MHRVSYYPPGKIPEKINPGDVGLTSGDYRIAEKIKELQRGAGYRPEHSAFGHMFCCQQEDGGISEALEHGVEYEHVSKYRDVFFAIVELGEPLAVRQKAVSFGWEVLRARPRYSYETIALMWAQIRYTQLSRMVGFRKPSEGFDFAITFQRTNTSICSGYGAEWLKAMGYSWKKGTGYVMPARVARRFGAVRG